MKSSLRSIFVLGVFGSVFFLAMLPIRGNEKQFHSEAEKAYFLNHAMLAEPLDSSLIFPTSTNCKGCHGFDPQGNAMVTSQGEDVNVHDDWQTSMMANSAKDPFWRAKVSHEILINPSHSLDLQTKCTSCHAPQGHFTAIMRGADHYTIDEMLSDTTAMDGVSCGACHMKSEADLENLISGNANYDTTRVMYGPYQFPFAAPMGDFVGFEPLFSEHINSSGICASCHTLLTNSVDLAGQLTGESFVEQATYHEWINSAYDDDGNTPTSCQSCHMPRLEDNIVISANYAFLQPRAPFGLHDLIGANTTMIQLMKENKKALDIDSADEHFDETIEKTLLMLQQQSLDTELTLDQADTDSVFFSLKLTNKAGHKFPSGYPSRRAFVTFVLTSEAGDTIFQSGVLQTDFEVAGQTAATEPHHQVIRSEDQVQIYEFVLGDVNGNFTTILERAHQALKDNRLPPLGFTTSHSAYDTTRIYGDAMNDPNFNFENGEEGSGTDVIHYHLPLNGYNGFVSASAEVYYQALPPKWMAPMFAESTPEIDSFRQMYENADLSPVLIASQSMDSIFIKSVNTKDLIAADWLTIYPNPTTDGRIFIAKAKAIEIQEVRVFDLLGRLVSVVTGDVAELDLPEGQQLFLLEIHTAEGVSIHKVLR